MVSFSALDALIAVILAAAAMRGVFVGMIREGFSVAAIGAAIVAGRYGAAPVGDWLNQSTAGEIGGSAATWIGAAVCALLGGVFVGTAGRWLRRGARMVGLGMADRVGGAAVGAAEGAVVASLVILGATWAFGREHPAIHDSYSLSAFDELRVAIERGELPDLPMVSSGPPNEPPKRR